MPDDRFLHVRCCHSAKVTGLTDLEFRVWVTYLLRADDYGVMRMSAAALRSGSDALEPKPTRTLERSFQRLVDVGLLRKFDHQGRAYVYQHDWQEFQHVVRPRRSVNPVPPVELIAECATETRKILTSRVEFGAKSLGNSNFDAEEKNKPPTRLIRGDRQEADGDRQEATLRDRFDAAWAVYPRKVGRGAAWRAWSKLQPDAELTRKIIASVEDHKARDVQWRKDGGQYIPHFSTFLNQERWTDEIEAPAPTPPPTAHAARCSECGDSGLVQGKDDPFPKRCDCRTQKARTA